MWAKLVHEALLPIKMVVEFFLQNYKPNFDPAEKSFQHNYLKLNESYLSDLFISLN